jgi:putative salt-induced outer membrane protein YdiY
VLFVLYQCLPQPVEIEFWLIKLLKSFSSYQILPSWIIQAQALYIRKLGEHVELKQSVSAKQAIKKGENSIYKAETSITTKLISTLQLKFTFTMNYNTDIEDDKKNLDTQTAVTLVYSF